MGILMRAGIVSGREVIIEVADVHAPQSMTVIIEVVFKAKPIFRGLDIQIALSGEAGQC